MKKKLLIFHQALAPYRVDLFNHLAEQFDAELVLFDTNLVNQKFDQKVLVRKLTCPISYLLGGFRWKDRYFRIGALRKIWRTDPDIVIGCEYSLVTIAIALYRFFFRARFKLYTMTDDNLLQFRARKGLKASLQWLFVRILDGFIVTNEETKIAYEEILPARSYVKCFVVPILHDYERIRENEVTIIREGKKWRTEHLANFKKVALFVGRLDPVKNVKWLVEQFGLIRDVALVMVGAGPQEAELRDMVDGTPLANVFLVGRKEGEGVYEMMAMADVLVLPSAFEPYGAVVGEALQWGTPCVVSDRVGAKGLLTKDNGAVYCFDDALGFRESVERILRIKTSQCALIPDYLGKSVCRFVKEACL